MNVFIIVTEVGVPNPSRRASARAACLSGELRRFALLSDVLRGLLAPMVFLRVGLLPFWVRVGEGESP